MPEGDTIFRLAKRLHLALAGSTVTATDVRPPIKPPVPPLEGQRVVAIESRGKNLLMRFDDGRVLHSHMRMNGRWQLYDLARPWQRAAHHARFALITNAAAALCFDAPVVKLWSARDAARDPLSEMGEDLLSAEFDSRRALEGLRALNPLPLGEAVMDQRGVAGIGNVYKSELLFACGLDPFAPTSHFSDEELLALIEQARDWLRRSVVSQERRTTPERLGRTKFYAYRRSGSRCLRCDAQLLMKRQGALARSTYYCPDCQRPRSAPIGK